jgi:hypothetical protein
MQSNKQTYYKEYNVLNQFVGTWKLISFEFKSSDNQSTYPLGQDAVGYLIYSEVGYMSVALMKAERTPFVSGDIRASTLEEKIHAADTYFSYCGRYEIQENKIIHHVEVSSFPNLVGTDQERLFQFEDNNLILSTPPFLVDDKLQTSLVIWKRVDH